MRSPITLLALFLTIGAALGFVVGRLFHGPTAKDPTVAAPTVAPPSIALDQRSAATSPPPLQSPSRRNDATVERTPEPAPAEPERTASPDTSPAGRRTPVDAADAARFESPRNRPPVARADDGLLALLDLAADGRAQSELILALSAQRERQGSDPGPVAHLLLDGWHRFDHRSQSVIWTWIDPLAAPRPWPQPSADDGAQVADNLAATRPTFASFTVVGADLTGAIGLDSHAPSNAAFERLRSALVAQAQRGSVEPAIAGVRELLDLTLASGWEARRRTPVLGLLAHMGPRGLDVLTLEVERELLAGNIGLEAAVALLERTAIDVAAFVAGLLTHPRLGPAAERYFFDRMPLEQRIATLADLLAEDPDDERTRRRLFLLLSDHGRARDAAEHALEMVRADPGDLGLVADRLLSGEGGSGALAAEFLDQWIAEADPGSDLDLEFFRDLDSPDRRAVVPQAEAALDRLLEDAEAFDAARARTELAEALDELARERPLGSSSQRALRTLADHPTGSGEWEWTVHAALREGDWALARRATVGMLGRARAGEDHGASIEDLERTLASLDRAALPDFVDLD